MDVPIVYAVGLAVFFCALMGWSRRAMRARGWDSHLVTTIQMLSAGLCAAVAVYLVQSLK